MSQVEPATTAPYADAVGNCGFRFKVHIHTTTLRRLHNFLRVTEREFAWEMCLQIGKHEVDVPAVTVDESHVDAGHKTEYSDGGESGLRIATPGDGCHGIRDHFNLRW